MTRNKVAMCLCCLGLVLTLAVGCSVGATAVAAPVAVRVAAAARGPVAATLTLTGTVQAQAQVSVLPEVAGRITRLAVKMGSEVKAGDVIAELDASAYKLQQAQAEAALAAAQAKVASMEAGPRAEQVALAAANLKSAQERLAAMKDGGRPEVVAQAEANLKAAQARLDQVKNGPTPEQLAVVQQQLKVAKDQEYLAQQNVEELSYRTNQGTSHSPMVPLFSKGIGGAQLGVAYENTKLVEAQLAQLQAPPTPEQLTQLQAALDVAAEQLALAKSPYTEHDLAQAESAVTAAEEQLALAQKPFTANDLNAARASVDQAKAALDLAKLQVQKTTVTAPFDGMVSQKILSEGAMAAPSTPIVTLVARDAEVTVNVEEARLGSLRLGEKASLTAAAFPGEKFGGEVSAIAPAVDQRSHTVAVKIKPDASGRLMDGMTVQATLLTGEQAQALLVPATAVADRDGQKAVFVYKDGVAHLRPVKLGLADGTNVAIVEGLAEGEQVAVDNLAGLVDGQQVTVLP